MPALPPIAEFTAPSVTEGAFKTALTALRAYLAAVTGEAGSPADALATLGALFAGVDARAGAHAVTLADRGRAISASGTWTLTLPTAVSVGAGFAVTLVNAGSGIITVARSGGDTIDGATSVGAGPGRAAVLLSTGSAWISLGLSGTLAGRMLLADGAAATPALTFAADQDTGLTRPADNQIGLVTAGVLRAFLSAAAFQINLPVTGTAVTQTQADVTAGRLVRTGDAGWLLDGAVSTPPISANLDTHFITGAFRYNNGVPGAPSAAGGAFLHIARGTTSVAGAQFQLAWGATGGLFLRSYDSGVWSAWTMLYSRSSLLGTVSQSAGVPTGAVIERGSNANGEYVRFADGTQICTRSMVAASGAAASWTFPAAFVAAPVVHGVAQATVLSVVCLDSVPTTTASTFSARDKTDARRADTCHLTATGRWF